MEKSYRNSDMWLVMVLSTLLCARGDTGEKKSCTDSEGGVIPDGTRFIPDYSDACKTCICDRGYPILCQTAACSPPPGCKQTKPVPRECCKFVCEDIPQPPSLDHNTTLDGTESADDDNITNLSLRLVASTVTSFLVLALLLFMVHRLRQRRLMMAMRRFEAQARQQRGDEDDLDHYIPAAFLHIECPPYEDPPPPYSPPKPPHILPEESPPPYQEVENSSTDLVDANANVSNNNNNNDQSCGQHRQEVGVNPGPESERRSTNQNSGANIINIMDTFNDSSQTSPGETFHAASARSTGPSNGREDETELKVISRRESCPLERSTVPFHQDYSLFAGRDGRDFAGTSDHAVRKETGNGGGVGASAGHDLRQRNGDSHGNRNGLRGARRTGRSCSFSVARNPDEDVSMAGIALAPMSQSYHATTAESGVQTHGSYTASLSRHRARAANNATADHVKGVLKEEPEASSEKRMVTKPMTKCDASVQNSHRLLQAELRRNLPPVSSGERQPNPAPGSHVSAASVGHVHSPIGETFQAVNGGEDSKHDNTSPDLDLGIASTSPEHGLLSPLPRSQSVTSTFSVCSETGEVRLKRAMAEAENSVLQNDLQYPDHSLPRSSPPQLSLAIDHPLDPSSSHDNPSSLPNYTFPTNATLFPVPGGPHCASRSEVQAPRGKSGTAVSSRRSIPNPPSQELRAGVTGPGGRLHSAKPKHKKIHFVPLEKSKTFKAKKEKGKSSKKGEVEQGVRRHDGSTRPNSLSDPHSVAVAESSEPRMHQPKLADIMRGRLAVSNAQSVKQYGFVDSFASGHNEDGYLEPSSRNTDTGSTGIQPHPHSYHTLPHKPHGHTPLPQHLQAGHRRQVSYGDKPHANPAALRPKNKPRPLSGGPVVEPGRDPADPMAALPQNSVARRRGKTLHLKKGRQSYPNLDSAQVPERKVNCVDLGFVEPSHDSARTMCVDSELPSHSKRRAVDREKVALGVVPAGVLEGQMSSYV
ncbi:uncharacterized protein [Littorina saxatilis]|uniref:VWFC domain-containing protein n=1 Tax=Littorina saxatilis TaxID=31220 RepID=A0AAN9FWL7_9CAEN